MTESDIKEFQDAIRHMHGCASSHVDTVPVKETFMGKTVWDGYVEVFDLMGHPQARHCFAWRYKDGETWKYAAVVSPPIKTAADAVRAYIIRQAKKNPPI